MEWKEYYEYIGNYVRKNNYTISLADCSLIWGDLQSLLGRFTRGTKEQNYKIVCHFLALFNGLAENNGHYNENIELLKQYENETEIAGHHICTYTEWLEGKVLQAESNFKN